MSPALFNIYVNDLVDDLEDSNVGVPILQEQVTCLLYADDLSLLAESEPELQILIKVVCYLENGSKRGQNCSYSFSSKEKEAVYI